MEVLNNPLPARQAERLAQELTHTDPSKTRQAGGEGSGAPAARCWLPTGSRNTRGVSTVPKSLPFASQRYKRSEPGSVCTELPPPHPRAGSRTRSPAHRYSPYAELLKSYTATHQKTRIPTQNGAALPSPELVVNSDTFRAPQRPRAGQSPSGGTVRAAAGAPLSAPTPR